MRILHFYKTYITDSRGGVEQLIFQLINSTRIHQVESDMLFLSANKKEPVVDMHTHRAYRAALDFQIASTGFSFSVFSQFAELAKKADLIHYHFPWPFMDLVHFFCRVKKPSVLTYHSDIVRQKNLLKLYKPLMRSFLKQVDCIVATSPNYLKSSTVLSQYKEKTKVIPIGLDEQTYPQPTTEKIQEWRQVFGERFFLFVGVLRYYKGLHYLIEAMEGLDYPLVIVGDGPEESALKELASTLGLKNIHFTGSLSDEDKIALLQLCYAFVFPSHLRSEAFGISLLEAAMFGKPLLSCEIGTGTSYINLHNETGLVVEPDNPMALRTALQYLWSNAEEAGLMGKNARQRYLNVFTAERMGLEYTQIYRSLLSNTTVNETALADF